jgi:hypothetical protein
MRDAHSLSLDGLTPQQLLAETHEIAEQYRREVDTPRRTWPASIRDRVLALRRLGVKPYRIAKLSRVPDATVAYWCRSSRRKTQPTNAGRAVGASRFLALPVSQRPMDTPTVRTLTPTVGVSIPQAPFTAILPGGFEVRGLVSLEQVAELYRATHRGVALA